MNYCSNPTDLKITDMRFFGALTSVGASFVFIGALNEKRRREICKKEKERRLMLFT